MAHLLITSGPTRQYLDPVRFLTNASSGRMGCALAEAALAAGHSVTIVSGPVDVTYPAAAEVIRVLSTEDMLAACQRVFPACDGLIGVAAPCDYRPARIADQKIAKTGQPLTLQLVETPDIVATLVATKRPDQWAVAFALETENSRAKAVAKLHKKNCDLIVSNGPSAMNSADNDVEILDRTGTVVATVSGSKEAVARAMIRRIGERLILPRGQR